MTRSAFGVEHGVVAKSFLGDGTWKAASALSATERAAVRAKPFPMRSGRTIADHGIADAVQQHWQTGRDLERAHGSIPITHQGRSIRLVEADRAGVGGQAFPHPPRPGESQRRAPATVQIGTSGRTDKQISETVKHELAHTTKRKPSSALVRHYRDPQKAGGEEARAMSGMGLSPKEMRRSAYHRIARDSGKTSWGTGYRAVGRKVGSYKDEHPVARVARQTAVYASRNPDTVANGAMIGAGAVVTARLLHEQRKKAQRKQATYKTAKPR